MPTFSKPIDLVCAGGTAMILGFIDVFREEFEKIEFPIEIGEIRIASDPLRSVAQGCLQASLEETRALREMDLPTRDTVHVGGIDRAVAVEVPGGRDGIALLDAPCHQVGVDDVHGAAGVDVHVLCGEW